MDGIRIDFSDGRPALRSAEAANAALAPLGAGIWPIDFRDAPPDVLELLRRAKLGESDVARLKEHFSMSREGILAVLAKAGRRPRVEGGGAMETFVVSHGYAYPQLWIVEPGVDYTRFDRFHVNLAADGTGVDEVAQLLWGSGFSVVQRLPDGVVLTVELSCPEPERGWIVTYDGGLWHMGRLSGATPATKLLVQVIGPPRWSIRYDDEA